MRGPRQHFTHSKVMAWLAFDRAVRNVEEFGLDGPGRRGGATIRDEIHAQICDEGFDAELGAFTQSYGSKQLDAAVLMMPLVGFLPGDDPRVVGTVDAIERDADARRLRRPLRDEPDRRRSTGCPPGEGAFLPCSFWLADNLALHRPRTTTRVALFERLLGLANDVGLLAEEYDPVARPPARATSRRRSPTCRLVNTAAHLSQASAARGRATSDLQI